jgi:hypothetical protein
VGRSVVYSRSWGDIFRQILKEGSRKKISSNKKEREGPWNRPQMRKSIKVACGDIFLMIFTIAWKTLLGFPPLPPARRWNYYNRTEN